jgi:primosomal protein N' (replication factor Y)
MTTTLIARVAIAKTTRGYDRGYDYLVPGRLVDRAKAGCRALVPFGVKKAERNAVILFVYDQSKGDILYPGGDNDALPGVTAVSHTGGEKNTPGRSGGVLKTLIDIPDEAPLLLQKDIDLAAWMKKKYNCTWFDALSCMLPAGWERRPADRRNMAVKGVKAAADTGVLREAVDTLRVNRTQQIHVLERMLSNPAWITRGVPVKELLADAGVSRSVIDSLVKKGFLAYVELLEKDADIGVYGDLGAVLTSASEPRGRFELTDEQEAALSYLTQRLDGEAFSEALLYGVTGSGKTEIYMRLISRVISRGRQAIALVPEISLTPQMTMRFTEFFGDDVAIFHSRLSDSERRRQWRRVRDGAARIALGARSAVFAPFDNLGAVIIDEEHETSYKSDMTPRYHTADIAAARCKIHGALLVYGSATPSVDLFYRAQNGLCGLLVLKKRANRQPLPKV